MVKLKGSFGTIPEGTYVMEITGVKATPRVDPNIITVTFKNVNDILFNNNYKLDNKGGAGAYFYLCKALGIDAYADHDEQSMVGRFVKVKVIHNHVVGQKDGADLIYPNIKEVIFDLRFKPMLDSDFIVFSISPHHWSLHFFERLN